MDGYLEPFPLPPLGVPSPFAASLLVVVGVTSQLALSHFWLWLGRRGETLHLWVAGMSLAALVFPLCKYLTYAVVDPGLALVLSKAETASALAETPLLAGVVLHLANHPLRGRRLAALWLPMALLLGVHLATGVFTEPVVAVKYDVFGQPYMSALVSPRLLLVLLPVSVAALVTLAMLWRTSAMPGTDRAVILVGVGLYAASGGWEILRVVVGGPSIMPLGFTATALSLDYLTTQRFNRLHLGLESAVAERTRDLARSNDELARLNEVLYAHARVDPLTQVGNRRRLEDDLGALHERALRYGHGYSLAMFDVDAFKAYNDAHGHQAGDVVLQAVARALVEACRSGDGVYRYGGEEFVVLFPEQDLASGVAAAERMRVALEALGLPHPGNSAGGGVVTVSAGVATLLPGTHNRVGALLEAADAALYVAKAAGRNRVQAARSGAGQPAAA